MKESTDKSPQPSPREICLIASDRMEEIIMEFTNGFDFLKKYPKSVTFFGASQFSEDNPYYQDARKLASRMVEDLNLPIISGGGPGIMEAANRGAHEAGGDSVGLLIDLKELEGANNYITDSILFNHFFVRKVCLSFSAEAFVFYPGGFGTSDEFFELLTLIKTKKVKNVPMICVGSDYWNEVKRFINTEMLKRGTVTEDDVELFKIVDNHNEIIQIMKDALLD